MRDCVLLDFDGTITYRDTTRYLIVELLKIRPLRFIGVVKSLLIMAISGKSKSVQRTKEKIIGYLLADLSDSDILVSMNKFKKRIEPLFRPKILKIILSHHKNNNLILVVSASPTFVIEKSLSDLPVTVLGTDYIRNKGIYSGQIQGLSCFGHNKVDKIRDWQNKSGLDLHFIEAWSDSLSDIHMLKMAKVRYWIGEEQRKSLFIDKDPGGIFVTDPLR